MNYLAHLLLSGDTGELMIGNFIGDAVKGSQMDAYSAEVQAGIRLHRKIDTYTDQHPIVKRSNQRLHPQFAKYAPVVSDIYFDHFLAKYWVDYHPETLAHFSQRVYAHLTEHKNTLPHKSQQFLHYMVSRDILNAYQLLEGIDRVFQGMASRASFDSGMERAAAFLEEEYEAFALDFREFFPEIVRYVNQELEQEQ